MRNNLQKLGVKRDEIKKSMTALLDVVATDDRTHLTEDEQTQHDAHVKELDGIDALIAAENKLIEAETFTMPTVPDINRSTETELNQRRGTNIETVERDIDGFVNPATIRVPARCRRWAGRLSTFKGPDAENKAYMFGMFLGAVLGNQRANRWLQERGFNMIEAVHQESVNTQGGYLVFPEIDRDIIDLVELYGVARQILRPTPMTSDVKQRPRRTGGLSAHFVGEGSAGTESTGTWDLVTLTAKDLMVLTRESNQLMDDAIIQTADTIAEEAARAIAEKEDDCCFNGDGTQTYGGITGILTRLSDLNGVDDGGGLVLSAGNLFSEATAAELAKVISVVPEYADMNSRWVCSKAVFGQIMERLALAAGGITYDIIKGASGGRQFMGYPATISQKCKKTDANSQINVLFGDFSKCGSFGDRKQLSIALSTDASVDGESVFERNQVAIRVTERFDIVIHDVGTATAAGPVVGFISAAA
jgi:HK97 family phage major capsid protein